MLLMESPAGPMEVENTETQIWFCTLAVAMPQEVRKDRTRGISPFVLLSKPTHSVHH